MVSVTPHSIFNLKGYRSGVRELRLSGSTEKIESVSLNFTVYRDIVYGGIFNEVICY